MGRLRPNRTVLKYVFLLAYPDQRVATGAVHTYTADIMLVDGVGDIQGLYRPLFGVATFNMALNLKP